MPTFKCNWIQLDGSTVAGNATISIDGETCSISALPGSPSSATGKVLNTHSQQYASCSVTTYYIEGEYVDDEWMYGQFQLYLSMNPFVDTGPVCSGCLSLGDSRYSVAGIA